MSADVDRVAEFRRLIRLDETEGFIDLSELQSYLLLPFPEGHPELRLYNWALSVRFLPPRRELWDSTLRSRTAQYRRLVKQIFRGWSDFLDFPAFENLHLQPGRFIECPKLVEQIHKDVPRLSRLTREAMESLCPSDIELLGRRLRRLERLLFVFSFVNTKCEYTQGVHELAMALYYTALAAGPVIGNSDDDTEAITFFMLFNLVIETGLYTLFQCIEPDKIQARLEMVVQVTRLSDSKFADSFFGPTPPLDLLTAFFPWVSFLFAQAFDLRDLLRLWDHLLVLHTEITDFAMMLAAGYVLLRKKAISKMNMEEVQLELQMQPLEVDVATLLRIGHQLWDLWRTAHESADRSRRHAAE
jgi:hypothetical protein